MSDLIDREEVLDRYEKICVLCGNKKKHNAIMCKACYLDDAISIVEDLPSAEPERKTGKWFENYVYDYHGIRIWDCRCSLCGHAIAIPYEYYNEDKYSPDLRYEYCPHCGAEMKK